jgi:hypothetical protein
MEPLNAKDAKRYAEFKEWTAFEAALLLAGCKPLPRGQIPEPEGNTPAFNLICAIQICGPSKDLKTPHTPGVWLRWYSEYLAGHDFPDFSQMVLGVFQDAAPPRAGLEHSVPKGLVPAVVLSRRRSNWRDVALTYVIETYREGKYKTAHVFYTDLVNKAGTRNSPFTVHDRELFLSEIGQSVSEKTIQNAMPKIKNAAKATAKIV